MISNKFKVIERSETSVGFPQLMKIVFYFEQEQNNSRNNYDVKFVLYLPMNEWDEYPIGKIFELKA